MAAAEVMLVRWPEDGDDGLTFARRGLAVLYVLESDAEPPPITSCLEDWVRIPGDERDLRARMSALEARSAAHQSLPWVDPDGSFHYSGQQVALPPDTVQIAEALVDRFGEVVADHDLPTESSRELRLLTTRLRARLRSVGIEVRRVGRRGYCLQARGAG